MDDDAMLRRLLETEQEQEATARRGATRRLREQAGEEATFVGTLLDLAESGAGAAVRTVAGRGHHGVVAGVGVDFCALRLRSGRWMYVALSAVGSVRVEAGLRTADPGTRSAGHDRTLAEALAYLAADRPRVTVGVGMDPELLSGELQSVGHDVATVRLDGPGRAVVHVRLPSITEVVVDLG